MSSSLNVEQPGCINQGNCIPTVNLHYPQLIGDSVLSRSIDLRDRATVRETFAGREQYESQHGAIA